MNRRFRKKIKNEEVDLVPLDKETTDKIKRINESTGEDAKSIIEAGIYLLEQTLGRQLVVKSTSGSSNLVINHYRKYSKVKDLQS